MPQSRKRLRQQSGPKENSNGNSHTESNDENKDGNSTRTPSATPGVGKSSDDMRLSNQFSLVFQKLTSFITCSIQQLHCGKSQPMPLRPLSHL
ncbi:hypothetical protein PtB15_8B534 [Puccinia triticina]|nr:hypothetical protein PtB15_8B534 [Puccinia triticina]